jgi:hypothetical protein
MTTLVALALCAAFGAGVMVGLSCSPAPPDPPPRRPDPARPPARPDFDAMWRAIQPELDAIDASRRN